MLVLDFMQPVSGAAHVHAPPACGYSVQKRPLIVIEAPPLLNEHLGVLPADKPFPAQAFIAQLAVDALGEAVLSGAVWRLDVGWPNVLVTQPFHDPSVAALQAP